VNLSQNRRKALSFLLFAIVAGAVAWLLFRDEETKPAPTAAVEYGPKVIVDPNVKVPRPQPPPPPPLARSPKEERKPEPKPIIDEIILEKDEVCEGEQNLITVKAHTTNDTDAFLHYTIGEATGVQVPVRSYKSEKGGKRQIRVFGRNNVATVVDMPHFRVKDCKVPRMAVIGFRVLPNTPDVYEFFAKIVEMGNKDVANPEPFKPKKFTWSFGDGASVTTHTPRVEHDYGDRLRDVMHSQFMVNLEIEEENGNKLKARRSVQILNPTFQVLHERGIVLLYASMEPRFPTLDDDGIVEQHVRIRHGLSESVRITKITATKIYEDSAGKAPPEKLDPATVLGSTIVPARSGIETTLQLDTVHDEFIQSINYSLEGTATDGRPARGRFSIMRPPPKVTKENSRPITDPVLLAKVKKAREILGKDVVNDEDIWRLEREGQFKDLEVDPDAVPANVPPLPDVKKSMQRP
jgi:hypothetical protein